VEKVVDEEVVWPCRREQGLGNRVVWDYYREASSPRKSSLGFGRLRSDRILQPH